MQDCFVNYSPGSASASGGILDARSRRLIWDDEIVSCHQEQGFFSRIHTMA